VWDVKYQCKVLIRTSKFASVLLESVGHGLKTCIRKGQNETAFECQGLQLGRKTCVKGLKKCSAFAENTHTTTIPIITQYFNYVNNSFTYLKKMSNNRRNQKYPIDKWIFACYNKYEHQFTF
jgi:hypothetical protein